MSLYRGPTGQRVRSGSGTRGEVLWGRGVGRRTPDSDHVYESWTIPSSSKSPSPERLPGFRLPPSRSWSKVGVGGKVCWYEEVIFHPVRMKSGILYFCKRDFSFRQYQFLDEDWYFLTGGVVWPWVGLVPTSFLCHLLSPRVGVWEVHGEKVSRRKTNTDTKFYNLLKRLTLINPTNSIPSKKNFLKLTLCNIWGS